MKTITIDGVEYTLIPKKKHEWRLPTVNELMGIYNYEKGKPRIDGFSSNTYWSSTTREGHPSDAWYVYFRSGSVNSYNKDYDSFVRCVRDTKDGLVWSKSIKFKMTWYEAIEYAKNLEE